MKLIIIFSIFLTGCLAVPQIPRMSDLDMHPHKFADKKLSDKAMHSDELSSDYWLNNAKHFVQDQIKKTSPNKKIAKNVIFFLGDGMSHYTIAATRVAMGGEEKKVAWEDFPYTASSKTYCVDVQVSDSACTATAYLAGIKTNDGEIGINAKTSYSNCTDQQLKDNYVDSIGKWSLDAGKSVGVVTTTRITHASPAGVYAHTTSRDWEDDTKVTEDGCNSTIIDDIAEQLVYGDVGRNLTVIFGGGSRHFIPNSYVEHGAPGRRRDNKHLINEWLTLRTPEMNRTFVRNRAELMEINPKEVGQIFGLFHHDHIPYKLDIDRDNQNLIYPTLSEMTTKAIDILSEDEDGYFLFVEGGRIDHGHHGVYAKQAVSETIEFSKAIEDAVKMVDIEETLIIVTADHGHVMTIGGYADRSNNIFEMAGTGTDNLPYLTLSYANGEGYQYHYVNGERVDPSTLDRSANSFRFPATVPLDSETHGGEDVGVWAVGAWSHLFQGVLEQHVIAHILAYASCVGNGLKACD